MNFNKVITHDTTFHADDVFAVALLGMINPDFELIRTRNPEILEAGRNDPQTVVLDVGGIYDPAMLNFDHHQDMNLLSAAGLVFLHIQDIICPRPEAQPFFASFISAIDLMDTNRGNIYAVWDTLPSGFRNVSGIIGGFNRDVTDAESQYARFGQALIFATTVIDNELYNSNRKADFELTYANRTILPNNVAIFEDMNSKNSMVSADQQVPNGRLVLATDFISGIEFRFHHGEFRRYRFRGKPGDGWLESANNNGLDEYQYCFVSAVTNDGFYYRGFESEIAGQRTPHILPGDKFQPFSSLEVVN